MGRCGGCFSACLREAVGQSESGRSPAWLVQAEELHHRSKAAVSAVQEVGLEHRLAKCVQRNGMVHVETLGLVRKLARRIEQAGQPAGEERLVAAVETGLIPITLAMEISKAETEEAQNLLLDAYETGKLRGKKLAAVRRLLDMRMRSQRKGGLPVGRLGRKTSSRRMTAADLMQVYQREAEKQRLLVKKSDFTHIRLLFVVEALKDLLANDGFINLLRAEGLATMPRALKARVSGDDHG